MEGTASTTAPPPASIPSGGGKRLAPLFLLPLVPWAWPALAALLATSEVPRILGRWSTSFFAFNVLSVAVVALLLWAWRRGRLGFLQSAYAGLIVLTVLAPMNNQLRELPSLLWLMPLVRLSTGAAAALAGFEHYRRYRKPQGLAMGLGVGIVMLSLVDLLLAGWIALSPARRMDDTGLRETYALAEVGPRDVVLVGDSFVWGQGVDKDERFGDVLERLAASRERPGRVFSLGQKGFGLVQYAEILSGVPAGADAGRVVVALYLNDMPPQETLRGKVQDAGSALGRGFPSIRLVGDKIAQLLTPDVDAYHAFLVESYDPAHPTYAERWALMQERVVALERLAAGRSAREPLMLILPLMVDFADYPLDDTHERIAAAARDAGFEVVDLLPVFRAELGDGVAHRNAPDDNHFDAATHALVARLLLDRI